MNYILFDSDVREHLLPFTYTRPVSLIRVGILTIAEKWEKHLQGDYSYYTEDYLQEKFPTKHTSDNIYINGSVCPTETLATEIMKLKAGESLVKGNCLLAQRVIGDSTLQTTPQKETCTESIETEINRITRLYDIFSKNGLEIQRDFTLLTKGRISEPISGTNQVVKKERIFIEKGAKVEFSILNASEGPIYIGRDAEIMEGCKIRGPFAMGEHATLKMDAKIYGPTTVGPYCKIGGEINNVVFFAYSNKGHDGFLGNAVVGEWCNIGADTNCSNLKNTYEEVKLWNYKAAKFEKTGLVFCGLMMGDYAKCGINTMFNTGTVVGVGANIFGAGFPRNFIPDFAWGGAHGFETFQINKFYKTAQAMCERRGIDFTDIDRKILQGVFSQTAANRYWDKTTDSTN